MAVPTELPKLTGLESQQNQAKIIDVVSGLVVDEDRQQQITDVFISEMARGLSANPVTPSSMQMDNTFVDQLTNGTEDGEYLALDLGSTNFRVLMIKMSEGKLIDTKVKHYEVSEKHRLGHATDLFDFLASCIADFVSKENLQKTTHKLGFTFSFPMEQKAIDKACLNTWTKSFNCSGAVGEDVGGLLEQAILRRGDLHVHVVAVLNDTTATLVRGRYLDADCAIGMILGTGNNGCYIEKASNIGKWEGDHQDQEVIVDLEWGSFGDNGVLDFLRTQWDDAADAKSLLQKSFTFEKYIGGGFLGELVRDVLLTLESLGLFGKGDSKLHESNTLPTSAVAGIEGEAFIGQSQIAKESLEQLHVDYNEDDVKVYQYVCGLISYRAILLVSLVCSTLLRRMDRKHCNIAIDGSLYEKHQRFHPLIKKLIHQYAPSYSFSLRLAKDGSGIGAGLIAAVQDRRNRK